MDELTKLASFIADLTYESLPEEVVGRAKEVLSDTVGVIIGGMREPEVQALADYAAVTAPGPASLMGHSGRVTPAWASLVHGTAGTTLEMDEGHAFARGHAAIHAVPPALALAQVGNASGPETLTAMVAGYEVAARAGVGTRLRSSVHPFGAWGVLGAAATTAWFKRFDAVAVAGTLELAASYAITPSFRSAYQGATVRNTYAGFVNHLGILAADLYELGFRGEVGGLQTTFGQILGHSFDPSTLTEGLGERYEIMRGYFKPYSGCRYTHAAIDAVLALRAEEPVKLENLTGIEVATYDIAAHLTDPVPKTPLAGRFSLPYVVAATLVNGSAGPEIFTLQNLADPETLAIASRVTVREDAAFTKMTPSRRPARVILNFTGGFRREKTVYRSKGDPDQPMTAAELEDKYRQLCDPTLDPDRAQEAWERIGQMEKLPRLDELMRLLRPNAGQSE